MSASTSRTVWRRCGFGLGLFAALACNTLLGIEEAHVDPRLTAGADESTFPNAASDAAAPEAGAGSFSVDSGGAAPPPSVTGAVVSEAPAHSTAPVLVPDAGEQPPQTEDTTVTPEQDAATTSTGSDLDAAATTVDAQVEAGEPDKTLCEKYCEEIQELCTEDLTQYRDLRQCLTVCEYFPEGELAVEENNNTVACRLRFAAKARYASGTELEAYCRQAGPGGDGRCGSNCEGYCTLMMGVCTEEAGDIYHYPSTEECMNACTALPTSEATYSTENEEISDGNHVQCRLFHVTSAAMLDTEEHCEHAVGLTLCAGSEEPPAP